jgi:hypothetical protein
MCLLFIETYMMPSGTHVSTLGRPRGKPPRNELSAGSAFSACTNHHLVIACFDLVVLSNEIPYNRLVELSNVLRHVRSVFRAIAVSARENNVEYAKSLLDPVVITKRASIITNTCYAGPKAHVR